MSKALAHIGKLKGQSIAACKSSAITVKEAALFTAVIAHKAAVQSKKRGQAEVRVETTSAIMNSATTSVVAKRPRGLEPVFGATSGFAQQDDDVLTSHIANFVLANGLDFSFVDTQTFKVMIKAAGRQSGGYVTPGRKRVAGALLDANYGARTVHRDIVLRKDMADNGLCFLGDGPTVNKTPLINLLASNGSSGLFLLGIIDCSGALAEGGTKSAGFLARETLSFVATYGIENADLFIFDGAINVQNAGLCLRTQVPRSFTIHGAEHVIALFFTDVARLPEIRYLISICKKLYGMFGGAHHGPKAMLDKYSKQHNRGRNLSFQRWAECRMAGFLYGFHRVLRLRAPLNSTVVSPEKIDGNYDDEYREIVQDEGMYTRMHAVLRSVWPALLLLRISDKSTPAMNQLLPSVKACDSSIARSIALRQQEVFVFDVPADPDAGDNSTDDSMPAPFAPSEICLFERIGALWRIRREPLVHPLSITGMFVNPVHRISMQSASAAEHLGLEECVRRMLYGETGTVLSVLLTPIPTDTLLRRGRKVQHIYDGVSGFSA